MNNVAFERYMENVRKKEIWNLSQQKKEEAIWGQNQIIVLQSFFTANLLAIEMKKKLKYTWINMSIRVFNTAIK